MYSTVRASASPENFKKATGTPGGGRMRVPLIVLSVIEADGIRVMPEEGPAPLAPPGFVAWLESELPRFPIGEACGSYVGIKRRLESLRDLDAREPSTDLFGDGARADLRAWAHEVREARALPLDVALERMPRVALTEEERMAIVRAVYSEPDGIYPWDCLGAKLDAEEAAKARALADEKARRARAEDEEKKPNAKTLDELGLVGISIEDGTPEHTNFPYLARCTPETLERIAVERRGSSLVFLVPKDALRGLELRAGKLGRSAVTVLPGREVIAVTSKELDAKTLRLDAMQAGWFLGARGVPARALSRVDLFDGRTPEGEWRERLFRELAKPMAEALVGPAARPQRLFFEKGIRGLRLSPEIVRDVYVELVTPLWSEMHPGETDAKPVERYFTQEGVPVPLADVRFHDGNIGMGRPYRVTGTNALHEMRSYEGGTFMPQTETKELLVSRTELEPFTRPGTPLPVSDAVFVELAREALEGAAPYVDVDELYREPDPKTWKEILESFGHEPDDAWRSVLAKVIEQKKDNILPDEIEEAIVSAGLHSRAFHNPEYSRIKALMAAMGFTKKQARFGGNPKTVFVRDGA